MIAPGWLSAISAVFLTATGCATDEMRSSSTVALIGYSQLHRHSAFALALCGTNDVGALTRLERLTARRDALEDWVDRSAGEGAFDKAVAVVDEDESTTDRLCPEGADPRPALSALASTVSELERRRARDEKGN